LQGVWFCISIEEIYDGLSAVYDYGQYGVELKKTSRDTGGIRWFCFMKILLESLSNFYAPTIWKASGHVDGSMIR